MVEGNPSHRAHTGSTSAPEPRGSRDLPPPKAPGAQCHRCPLRVVGRFVPSSGPERAEVAFVGEAPGGYEVARGEPFVGASGKLLNIVLDHHGINRPDVFLTNACLCRPPENMKPPKEAIAACKPRLMREIRQRGVETIVTMGNSANAAILGKATGITKLRVGPPKQAELQLPNGGVRQLKIVPTIHPAACLRNADSFPSLVTDVAKVFGLSGTFIPPDYRVVDNLDEALAAISWLEESIRDSTDGSGSKRLVVDIEVDVEKDFSFEHPDKYALLCVGIGYSPTGVIVFGERGLEDRTVRDYLGRLLERATVGGQNLKFDLRSLRYQLPQTTIRVRRKVRSSDGNRTSGIEGTDVQLARRLLTGEDTMLIHYVLDERTGHHSLDEMGMELLGAPDWKDDIKKYKKPGQGYGVIPRDVLYKYNAYDVCTTYQLLDLEEAQIDRMPPERRESTRNLIAFLNRASNLLMHVETAGMFVDVEYMDKLTHEYTNELEDIEENLNIIVMNATKNRILEINPRSPKQIKEFLNSINVRVASTDEENMEALIAREIRNGHRGSSVHRFARTLLQHRGKQKEFGTYVQGTRRRLYRGRLHPTFLLHSTTTGRLSCRNPNLQNVPRGSRLRNLFVASSDNHTLIQADYSQAELRVLTYLSQDEYLRNIFLDPSRDIFNEIMNDMFGVDYMKQLSPEDKKNLRAAIKALVYGVSYGRTAHGVAKDRKLGLSIAKAQEFMDGFFDLIPGVVEFQSQVKRRIRSGADLVTPKPFERRRRFHLITKENEQDVMNEGLAFLPQSTASDICLQAAVWLSEGYLHNPDSSWYGKADIVNLVHDAIILETEKWHSESVTALMQHLMQESAKTVVGDYVPFETEATSARSWGELG
jgi:uracil-DNA glycosylase family 4